MVTLAFLAVLYFDPQFRHDILSGLKSYAGDSNKYFSFTACNLQSTHGVEAARVKAAAKRLCIYVSACFSCVHGDDWAALVVAAGGFTWCWVRRGSTGCTKRLPDILLKRGSSKAHGAFPFPLIGNSFLSRTV
jgi:hypothetical protein